MAKDTKKSPKVERFSAPVNQTSSSTTGNASTHSIVTTLSSNHTQHNESVNNTVMTSPSINSLGDTTSAKYKNNPKSSNPESESKSFETTLRSKTNELTQLVLSISKSVSNEPIHDKTVLGLNEGTSFDWEKVLAASEAVFDEYSNGMAHILKELEELNKQLIIWQESTFILDSEVLGAKINKLENWIQLKENFLKSKKFELTTSANLINDALKNLGNSVPDA